MEVVVAQHYDCTEFLKIVHFKMVNFILCEFCFSRKNRINQFCEFFWRMKHRVSLTLKNTMNNETNKETKTWPQFMLSDRPAPWHLGYIVRKDCWAPSTSIHCPPSHTVSYSGPTASSLWRKADHLPSRSLQSNWEDQTPLRKLVCVTLNRSHHFRDQ